MMTVDLHYVYSLRSVPKKNHTHKSVLAGHKSESGIDSGSLR